MMTVLLKVRALLSVLKMTVSLPCGKIYNDLPFNQSCKKDNCKKYTSKKYV